VTIKVNKATPTFTAPTAQESLTYTGREHALITVQGHVVEGHAGDVRVCRAIIRLGRSRYPGDRQRLIQSGTLTITNGLHKTYSFDLSTLLPKLTAPCDYGTITYDKKVAASVCFQCQLTGLAVYKGNKGANAQIGINLLVIVCPSTSSQRTSSRPLWTAKSPQARLPMVRH